MIETFETVNITAVLVVFPSQQIASVIDSYAAILQKRSDRDVFFLNTQGRVTLGVKNLALTCQSNINIG